MPRDSAAADRPASYLVGTAAAFLLFFRDRTKPINQLPFSPSAKFPKSGSSCESRVRTFLQWTPKNQTMAFACPLWPSDYPVAAGFSRRLVGQLSDGLVEIDNAILHAPNPLAPGGSTDREDLEQCVERRQTLQYVARFSATGWSPGVSGSRVGAIERRILLASANHSRSS